MILRISLFVVSALLLGAHFLHAGNVLPVAACLAAPSLFLYRKRWSLILLQVLAYAAVATWLETAIGLAEFRQRVGRSWTAAAFILVAVALFTLVAGLLLNSRCVRERYAA